MTKYIPQEFSDTLVRFARNREKGADARRGRRRFRRRSEYCVVCVRGSMVGGIEQRNAQIGGPTGMVSNRLSRSARR